MRPATGETTCNSGSFGSLWEWCSSPLLQCSAGVGYKSIQNAPPIPKQGLTTDGTLLFTGSNIPDGQNAWQSIGGQEIGTVWGHGAYLAPDWSADYLHRESLFMLNARARETGAGDFNSLPLEQRAALEARLQEVMRHNTYDPATRTIRVPAVRAAAFRQLSAYYADVFGNGRNEHAIPPGALRDAAKQQKMAAFFWWTAWAASTDRPRYRPLLRPNRHGA
jgi:nitric oxide reductase subunit B